VLSVFRLRVWSWVSRDHVLYVRTRCGVLRMRLRTHRYQTGHGLVVGAPGLSRPAADDGDASSGGGTEGIREEMGKSF
jgi:hypothetical protein